MQARAQMFKFGNKTVRNSLQSRLIMGVFWSAGLKVANTLMSLVIGIVLARYLGPDKFGVYTYIFAVVTIIGLPTKAGLPSLLVRETAKYQLNQNWPMLRGLLLASNGFAMLAACAAIVYIVRFWENSSSVEINAFFWALLLLPIVAFGNLREATLRGLRNVVAGQIPEMLLRPGFILIFIFTAISHQVTVDVELAVKYNALAAFLAFVVGAILLARALPLQVRQCRADFQPKIWLKSLVPLSLFSGMQVLNGAVSIAILGQLSNMMDVGLFRVALQGAELVAFGLSIFSIVLGPHVARLYEKKDMAKLQRILTLSTRASLAVALSAVALLVVNGELLLQMIFGAEYTSAYRALIVLCIGQMINAATGPVAILLNMSGHENETVKGIAVNLVINVSMCVLLIPLYGHLGAAVAATISFSIYNAIITWAAYRKTGINTFIVGKKFKG